MRRRRRRLFLALCCSLARCDDLWTLDLASWSQANVASWLRDVGLADLADRRLDGPALLNQEFTPFARVVSGMELLPKLRGESAVSQAKAAYFCEEYLDQQFPKLSIIEDVKVVG